MVPRAKCLVVAPMALVVSFVSLAAFAGRADAQEAAPPDLTPEGEPPPPTVEASPGMMESSPPIGTPIEPTSTQHTWLEARLGSRRWSEKSAGFGGGGFDLALGVGWKWLDLGVVGTFAATSFGDPSTRGEVWTFGPEIATRTALGGGTTLRLALDPLYALETLTPGGEPSSTHSLVGGNLLAEVLFTIDEGARPTWRVGVGAHVGKMWPTAGSTGAPSWDEAWIVGADLIVRSWW